MEAAKAAVDALKPDKVIGETGPDEEQNSNTIRGSFSSYEAGDSGFNLINFTRTITSLGGRKPLHAIRVPGGKPILVREAQEEVTVTEELRVVWRETIASRFFDSILNADENLSTYSDSGTLDELSKDTGKEQFSRTITRVFKFVDDATYPGADNIMDKIVEDAKEI